MDFEVPSWNPQRSEHLTLSVFYFQQTLAAFLSPFLPPVYTKFKSVTGSDAFIVKNSPNINGFILSVSTTKKKLFSVWIFIFACYRIFIVSGEIIRLLKFWFFWEFLFRHQKLCYWVWQQKQYPNHESLKVGQYIGDFWGYTLPVMCWRIGLVD